MVGAGIPHAETKETQMIATFDSVEASKNHLVAYTLHDALAFADRRGLWTCLPFTVPVPASKTLLAQCLRRGLEPATLASFQDDGHSTRAAIQLARAARKETPENPRGPLSFAILRGRLISVEIEYYPTGPTPATSATRDVKTDGSLYGGGCEVTQIAWPDNGRLPGLTRLRLPGRVDKSCGLHVHVDVRGLSEEQAMRAYERLVTLSRWFRRLVPPSRLRNRFCRWRANNTANSDRYCAFNWHSYRKFKTIEFRMQGNFNPQGGRVPGHLNMLAIENWALVCAHAARWAHGWSPSPRTWRNFLDLFPEPVRSWVILRRASIEAPVTISDRAMAV